MPKVFSPKQLANQAAFKERSKAGLFKKKKAAAGTSASPASESSTPVVASKGVPIKLVLEILFGVVVVTGVYILGRWVYRTYILNHATKAVAAAEDDVVFYSNQGQQQTYPDGEYFSIADSAYEGMRYSVVSDDYGAVVEAMKKLQNNLDVAKTIVAYGARQEYNFGIPDGQPRNLFQQMAEDLSESRRNEINADWIAKQITYRV